ncbi:prolactin-releasing peptide receptor-like [Clytia hemisphaerica]|uniref:prolactin-releasing peptide receptor-like n=1 Tax=Clytia hemisphaerica TaxID=252671 RepID=UPI0034D48A27
MATPYLNTSFYNSTINITTPVPGRGPPPPNEPMIKDWLLISVFSIIMVSGVTGNALVVYVFGKKRLLNNTELLILYLGIIDVISSFFVPLLNIYWIYTGYKTWHFGEIGCKILPMINPFLTKASGWVLLIFAVERYCAIVTPFTKRLTPFLIKMLCLGSLLISAAMYVHYSVALTHKFYGGRCVVPNITVSEFGFPECVFIIVRLLSFLFIFIFTNVRIYITLRKNNKRFVSKELRESQTNRTKKTMRILSAMGIVFIMLVFPKELLQLVYTMNAMINQGSPGDGIQFGDYIFKLNSWLKVLHTSNCCANIFIYANMQDSYKRQIRKMLGWLTCNKYSGRPGLHVNTVTARRQSEEMDCTASTDVAV